MTLPSKPLTAKVRPIIQTSNTLTHPRRAIGFFGDYDTGKTFAALSFPDPFVLYFDTNLSTLSKYPNVPFTTPLSWREMEEHWIPAIQSRRLSELVGRKVQTLIVDSVSFLNASRMEDLSRSGKMAMENLQWSELQANLTGLLRAGGNATKPHPMRPGDETYHFVCTVHMRTQLDKKGTIIKVAPLIDGQTRDQFFSFFDAVLVTDSQTVPRSVEIEKGKPPKTVYEKQRFAWTVDPNAYTKTKNHIGPIPPRLAPFTYDVLAAHWKLDGVSTTPPPNEVVEETGVNHAE
jgi:hypothetical protein